jgi:hypothetical protein
MKPLAQSLLDYNPTLLKAIAERRAVACAEGPGRSEMIGPMVEALLAPASVAIALADLSAAEQEALHFLLAQGGRIEGPRFAQRYGYIRPMGPARLEREQPWLKPISPAEGLWYRGLIFKAFEATEQGNQEMIYIPNDLLPLLELSPPARPSSLELTTAAPPAAVVSGVGRLRENVFSLLVYLQTTPVRLSGASGLSLQDKTALQSCLLSPLWLGAGLEQELDFLLHLGQRADLLALRHGRLRPAPAPTRAWLQADPLAQARNLQNSWRADPAWNDLWHTPGLVPQPTGWENSPLLARSKILHYLEQVEPGQWFSLAGFVAFIKGVEPDFQRPGGDYERWYLQDEQGNSLMGFAHWDKVEGALIRYLLAHILAWLGVVELGLPAETGQPVSFRLTQDGAAFLRAEAPALPPTTKPSYLQAQSNFEVSVSEQASLYDRFQLARFARLERRETGKALYRITRASVTRAFRNGVTAEQIASFLARATHNQTPLKLVETLLTWGTRQGLVELEEATLLRLADEGLATELRAHPVLGRLLGESLGPGAILVPGKNVAEARSILKELGYLE